MRRILFTFLLITLGFVGFSQDFPAKPNKLVNDYTNTLSQSEISSLEQKLVTFDDSTSIQIAIAIVKSVGDYDINEYALELGRKWGVGQAGKNTGIMIVAALGDRKISIQTGYGIEGVLPDVYTKRIIEEDIKPNFRSRQYFTGLDEATTSIIKYTKGEYKNDKPKSKRGKGGGLSSLIVLVVIIAIIIAVIKRGGGGGNGGQVIGGRGVADALFWSMLLGSGRGSGGGWGGGRSSGGGGFGGFGGGSFGGGGSSGSW